jgi:hypothetical protein
MSESSITDLHTALDRVEKIDTRLTRPLIGMPVLSDDDISVFCELHRLIECLNVTVEELNQAGCVLRHISKLADESKIGITESQKTAILSVFTQIETIRRQVAGSRYAN